MKKESERKESPIWGKSKVKASPSERSVFAKRELCAVPRIERLLRLLSCLIDSKKILNIWGRTLHSEGKPQGIANAKETHRRLRSPHTHLPLLFSSKFKSKKIKKNRTKIILINNLREWIYIIFILNIYFYDNFLNKFCEAFSSSRWGRTSQLLSHSFIFLVFDSQLIVLFFFFSFHCW